MHKEHKLYLKRGLALHILNLYFCIFYLLHMIILHQVTVRKEGVEKGII